MEEVFGKGVTIEDRVCVEIHGLLLFTLRINYTSYNEKELMRIGDDAQVSTYLFSRFPLGINDLSFFLFAKISIRIVKRIEVSETHVVGENPTFLLECVPPSRLFLFLFIYIL